MAVLPAEIPTGLVTGQFYFVNEDNVDADTDPTLQVVTGRVTFTCEAESPLRMPNKDAVIIPLVFEAEFDAQGRLVPKGQTNLGIELPASDSPEFNPTGFTWRVSFDLSDATTGYTIRMESFSIFVPGGVTSDLVDLMPVSTEPGTLVVQGPRGEQGIQGIQGPQGVGVPAGGSALQLVRKNAANTGTEWATPSASDLSTGTLSDARLPQRLGINPGSVSDWNTINQTGWWMGYDALNSPTPATWFMGMVEAHNNIWVTQTVHNFTADGSDNTQTWRRSGDNSGEVLTWSAWYKLQLSQAEQDARYQALIAAGTTAQYWRGDKTWQALDKAAVGLGSVDNTSDLNKPVSTAQQTALNAKANDDGLLKGTLGRKFRLIAGTIRNTGTGWFVLDDTGHRPTGVTGVTATATSIDIAFAATAKVVSFVCGPDEVYAARGLRMGSSVALNAAKIFCYEENEHRISDYVTYSGGTWSSLNGVFTGITFNGAGLVTLNHEDVGTSPLSGAVSARPPAGAAANTVAFLGGMTATTTNVEIRTPAGVVISGLATPTNLWVERAGKRKTTVAVDPANLTETNGNIWFIGVVED